MTRSAALPLALALGLAFAAPACSSRGGPVAPAPAEGARANGGPGSGGRTGPEPFREVVPETAETDSGVFVVHRTDDELLFEIPDSILGRELLVISRIARVPTGLSGFIVAGHKVRE